MLSGSIKFWGCSLESVSNNQLPTPLNATAQSAGRNQPLLSAPYAVVASPTIHWWSCPANAVLLHSSVQYTTRHEVSRRRRGHHSIQSSMNALPPHCVQFSSISLRLITSRLLPATSFLVCATWPITALRYFWYAD